MDTAATALPALYISHGSPMTALDAGEAGSFWRALGPAITQAFGTPKAVLAVSAHSLTREPVLLAAARHAAVYDFSGFPEALYRLRYDAPGAPALAGRVAALLRGAGLPAHVVDEGGLDHGIWTPLRSMFPEADIPVLPLAWPPTWAPDRLFALGQALAPLAAEGVLVMGSGAITHNLRLFSRNEGPLPSSSNPLGGRAGRSPALGALGGGRGPVDAPEHPESAAFRGWVNEHVASADWPALFEYRAQAPHAAYMHPTDEHWRPIYVAAGAGGGTPGIRLHASVTYGHLAMDAYAFGPQAARLAAALAAA